MLQNLILSTWRNINKNLSSSLINFIGLMMGTLCALLIGLFIYQELSYDRYHENADQIYRVTFNETAGEIPGIRHLANVGPPVGPTLKQTYSQIEDAVRFRYSPDRIVRHGEVQFYENGIFYADPSVFHVFTFPLLKGSKEKALELPNSIVLTEEMARKYFGDEDPIGKTLTLDNNTDVLVTGVLKTIPTNTHLKFNFLLPFEAFKVPYGYPVDLNSWGWLSFHTYVKLKAGTSRTAMEKQFEEFARLHWDEERAKHFKLQLQPLTDIYLGDVPHEAVEAGNKTNLLVLGAAAILIILLAAFNYANLYTAVSITRAKEMGMRKVMGAQRKSISGYIFSESILMVLFAGVVSLAALPVVLEYANTLGLSLVFGTKQVPVIVFGLIMLAIAIGALAALYPSAILSTVNNQLLLKGNFRNSHQGILIRRSLIFFQFCITIALIASVIVINNQIEYIKTKNLGYARDELLLLRMPREDLVHRFPSIQAALMANPHVKGVALGGGRLDGDTGNVPIFVEGNLDEGIPMAIESATLDFLKTIGVQLIAGREIASEHPADTLRGVLLNEAALKVFGWTPEEALGKKIRVGDIVQDGEVIGITPDFNFGLIHSSVAPLVLYYPRTHLQDIYVRFNVTNDIQGLVSSLQQDWRSVASEFPFDYVFLSQYLNSLYQSEKFFSMLFWMFAGVAIFISCLGLFALISQETIFRMKEVGVRKVLGASVGSIVYLFVKPFLVLILFANLIAWPLGWIGMSNWLDGFSYHVPLSFNAFLLSGVVTTALALITIGHKTIQAGSQNPVTSLRSE